MNDRAVNMKCVWQVITYFGIENAKIIANTSVLMPEIDINSVKSVHSNSSWPYLKHTLTASNYQKSS